MDVHGTGQLIGSESEIASVLSLALQRFPNIRLVFDGVDECIEPSIFLQKLYAICKDAKCRILLVSRPNLQLPRQYQNSILRMRLTMVANLNDIQQFLRPQIESLLVSCLLPSYYTVDEVVEKISSRAKSLFLWAKLMVNYLECPAPSPRDRADAVDNLSLLEGLDALYSKILTAIQRQLRPEQQTVFRVFQWLIAAYRPLQLNELRAAIAIRLDNCSTSQYDYIVDFAQSLVLIYGALVETHEDGSVQFIHLSAKEHLTSKEVLSTSFSPGNFHVDVGTAHLALTNYSLSYLLWDVPASPLSGSSKVAAHDAHLRNIYPLLEYALHWWEHAVDGFNKLNEGIFPHPGLSQLTQLLNLFLGRRPVVTLWIEACWTFSVNVHLRSLEDSIARFRYKAAYSGLKALRNLISKLCDDLDCLDKEWSHILTYEPNEIWELSNNIFRKSQFLIETNSGSISWLARDNSANLEGGISNDPLVEGTSWAEQDSLSVVLASQVSGDGSRLASLTLVRPR